MTHTEHILLTGATGLLGAQLVFTLLQKPHIHIHTLVRTNRYPLEQRRDRLIADMVARGHAAETVSSRLSLYSGDVTEACLGMSDADYTYLQTTIDHVIHSAASVRFDLSKEAVYKINVQGTQHMLDLFLPITAEKPHARFEYVSTCYLAGNRQGVVYEHECDEGQTFRNSYEWSKCQAEKLLRSHIEQGKRISIYRPSIIVGDSRDGAATAFNALYQPVRIYVNGWWRTVPGRPDAYIDIVPVNYVADMICELHDMEESVGLCFHLASGQQASRLREITEFLTTYLNGKPIGFFSPKLWENVLSPCLSLFLRWSKRGRAIIRVAGTFMPYFTGNPQFDTSNVDRLTGKRPEPFLDYFPRILDSAVAQKFGR